MIDYYFSYNNRWNGFIYSVIVRTLSKKYLRTVWTRRVIITPMVPILRPVFVVVPDQVSIPEISVILPYLWSLTFGRIALNWDNKYILNYPRYAAMVLPALRRIQEVVTPSASFVGCEGFFPKTNVNDAKLS